MTDQQLLRDYAGCRSEAAFAELVHRHVDLVYSAALRMVRDAHLAQDVTQGAFLALAQNASQLADRSVLSGWLHRTAQNLAANAVRSEVRRRAREQEAATMNELLAGAPDAPWEQIAPHLDAALGELGESDRDALLLRYFERKTAQEMARTLGISDEAAQKRVNRAVDRLREHLAKRGLAAGAAGLAAIITANAVQAAPAGLLVTISAAASALTATTLASATKAIAMTTLQKVAVAAALTATISTGAYEAHQASNLRDQNQTLQQQQAPLASQIQQLTQERDDATNRLALLAGEVAAARNSSNQSEMLAMRAEISRLRAAQKQTAQAAPGLDPASPGVRDFLAYQAKARQIAAYLEQMPDKKIPELKLLTDDDWLAVAESANFDSDADIRKTLRGLRSRAKQRAPLGGALSQFTQANNGRLPDDITQLKPYFKPVLQDQMSRHAPAEDIQIDDPTIDAVLARYTLLHTGNVADQPPGTWLIGEKSPVDKDYDSRAKFGIGTSTDINTGVGEAGDPEDPAY